MRHLSTADGVPTNAVFAMAKFLLKLEKEHPSENGAFVFDKGRPHFRMELAPDYKANRPPMPEELQIQLPVNLIKSLHIIKILNILGCCYFSSVARERARLPDRECHSGKNDKNPNRCSCLQSQMAAVQPENTVFLPFQKLALFTGSVRSVFPDDLIGSIATAFPAHRVVIFSGDKDLSQVIDDRVEMLVPDPAGSVTKRGVEEVVKKFGVPPSGIVDYLALIGDASDNIPGVEGVGPKTAAALLQQFGSGEELFRRLDEVKRESLREKLAQAKDLFEKNVKLVTLDTAPPEDVVWEIGRLKRSAPDYAKIRAIAKKMELKSILREIDAIAGPGEEDGDLFSAVSAACPEKAEAAAEKEASSEMTQMDLF